MRKYKLVINRSALEDIQESTNWYNSLSEGLGARFQKQVKFQIEKLRMHPEYYGIRYAEVRCTQVKKFPFLIHYILDELNFIVEVFAVRHTGRIPI